MNGTSKKHGTTVGYIVLVRNADMVGLECHGYDDPTKSDLLGCTYVTLFDTRYLANKAVRDARAAHPNSQYVILRACRRIYG